MKKNRSVLYFVISTSTLYVSVSFLSYAFGNPWIPLKKINLFSDIIYKEKLTEKDTVYSIPIAQVNPKANQNFNLFKIPHLITNFNSDTTKPSMSAFLQKLHDLKTGKKRKVRIAYLGDSMIEGDLLTQTFRELMQKEFGGSGVGFVPITSLVSQFRTTVSTSYSDGWIRESFKTEGKKNKLFLSGYLFHGVGDWVQMKDQTIIDNNTLIEKSLLCGYAPKPVTITLNDKPLIINPKGEFNRIVTDKDLSKSIKLVIENDQLPVYGISFESESGVFIDNFSFRGITGIEYNTIDSIFLSNIEKSNPYDLIVFQYGVNVLFRPNDKNFNWYGKAIKPIVQKLRNCFPASELLISSTADRAFNYEGEYKSAIGIDSLIKVQATLAYESGACFYNQFQTMGGKNSIIEWASRKPSLANKDYVHPNHNGAAVLGKYFFEAIMDNYKKYKNTNL